MSEVKEYLIERGQHFAKPFSFSLNGSTSVTRKCRFSQECVHPYINNDSFDWSKLFGMSNGLHQISSVRFGWRPEYDAGHENTGQIEICFMSYNNAKPVRTALCVVEPNVDYWFTISVLDTGRALFTVETMDYGTIASQSVEYANDGTMSGYMLNPYFGGDNAAPHDMVIYMENVGERIICLKD